MPANRVAVADDDPFMIELLRHKLEHSGFDVSAVQDGAAALAHVRSGLCDLLVLDAMMPVMDGFEVLRRLKADPDCRHVRVIMLTALKREDDLVMALKLGADDYLIKPFIPGELLLKIANLLSAPIERGTGGADGHRARA